MEAFDAGFIDIVSLSGSHIEEAKRDEELKDCVATLNSGRLAYLSIMSSPEYGSEYLCNKDLRLAISNAIDRGSICSNVLFDAAVPAYNAVCPNLVFDEEGNDFIGTGEEYKELLGYDPAKAREHLEAAFAELGTDHIELNIVCENDGTTLKVMQAVKEMVEKTLPELTINIASTTFADRISTQRAHSFEISNCAWNPDYYDPTTFLNMFITGNSDNHGVWSNVEYDELLEKCNIGEYADQPDLRWETLKEAEEILLSEAAMIPLYSLKAVTLVREGVEGYYPPVAGDIEYSVVSKNKTE